MKGMSSPKNPKMFKVLYFEKFKVENPLKSLSK